MTKSAGIEEIFDQVGQPSDLFSPPIVRLAIGAGALSLLGILFLLTALLADAVPRERIGMAACSAVPLAIAVVILLFAFRRRRLRVLLCPGAIVVRRRDDFEVFPWENIVAVRETKEVDQIYFISLGTYRAVEIEFADGRKEFFDRNRIRRIGEFIDSVQQEVWRRQSTVAAAANDLRLSRLIAAWPGLSEAKRERLASLIGEEEV